MTSDADAQRPFKTAEAWGHALHDVLQPDSLAGALLGYDDEVLDRLQAQCSV